MSAVLPLLAVGLTGCVGQSSQSGGENAASAPPQFALFVYSEPMPGAEVEYHRWYDTEHVPAIVRVPGFGAWQRYQALKADTPASTLPPYLASYPVKLPSVDAINESLGKEASEGRMGQSPAFNYASSVRLIYRPLGGLVLAKDVPGTSPAPVIPGKTMQSMALQVLSNAAPGQDEAYNVWYRDQHVPDVLRIPGFVSAQRYEIASIATKGITVPRYMVMFHFESADLEATIADLKLRNRSGITKMSSAFNVDGVQVYYFRVLNAGPAR